MNRKTLCLLLYLAGLMVFVLPASKVLAAQKNETSLTIQFHYIRYEEDYKDWTLWLWHTGADGREYVFTHEEGKTEATATIHLTSFEEDTEVGILLKFRDWEAKDVEEDRYLDISRAENGILTIYLLQGEEQIFYGKEDLSEKQKLLYAAFDDLDRISFRAFCPGMTDKEVHDQVFFEEEETGKSALSVIELFREGDVFTGVGVLDHAVDLTEISYLSVKDSERKKISMGDVFSSSAFEEIYAYDGDDLGATYNPEFTEFRVWAPTATRVEVNCYQFGEGGEPIESSQMERGEKGVWYRKLSGDYNGIYYTYSVTVQGEKKEAVDPYAKACGVNGLRGMVIDLDNTDPEGFQEEEKPELDSFSDIILYEMSVRDFTAEESSGVKNRGKYLGLTEEGTSNANGDSTALDFLGNLGVTHVHLLPVQDFAGVDEKNPEDSYNWGYNPLNYNVPEGSYSTDPYHGDVRIREFKQMVASLHRKGLRVVMDVVYNHTYGTEDSNFNFIVPGYYYRITREGKYSNGSACGNEVATERAMARKFIVDSVVYWAREYHIDGFRFDLMGLIDLETMRLIRGRLNEVDEKIFVYGEGWTGGSTISTAERAESVNASKMPGISVFSNVFRRGIQNYVSGFLEDDSARNAVLFGVVAATPNEITKQSMGSWTIAPSQCINYASCHDGYTLWDLIQQNCPGETKGDWEKRNRLSAAIVMTTQGIPFIHSGEELLRSKIKEGEEGRFFGNSYNAGDEVNSIKWDQISENREVLDYYRGLIEFRKAHSSLSYETVEELQENLQVLEETEENVIAFMVKENQNWFLRDTLYIVYNPNVHETSLSLPEGTWKVYVDAQRAGTEVLARKNGGGMLSVSALSALALVHTTGREEHILPLGCVCAIVIVGLVVFFHRKKRTSASREV